MADGNPFAGKAATASPVNQSAEDFLDGGASVAAKWPTVGFMVEGTVLGWNGPVQQTDMKTGEPLFWEGKAKTKASELKFAASQANPCLQLLIELQCEPTGVTWETNRYIKKALPDDDGVRTAYVQGAIQAALRKARRDAGSGGKPAPMEAGAYVKITRGEDKKMPNDMYGYTFTAEWTPAKQNGKVADSFVDGDDPFAKESAATDEPPF